MTFSAIHFSSKLTFFEVIEIFWFSNVKSEKIFLPLNESVSFGRWISFQQLYDESASNLEINCLFITFFTFVSLFRGADYSALIWLKSCSFSLQNTLVKCTSKLSRFRFNVCDQWCSVHIHWCSVLHKQKTRNLEIIWAKTSQKATKLQILLKITT